MVLGRQDDSLHAGTLECGDPLLYVEDRRVEGRSWGIPIAPLEVVVRVETKVDEGISL